MLLRVLAALLALLLLSSAQSEARREAVRVKVTVVDRDNLPLDGARVRMIPSDGIAPECTTDDEGSCVVLGLFPGGYTLKASWVDSPVSSRPVQVGPEGGQEFRIEVAVVQVVATWNSWVSDQERGPVTDEIVARQEYQVNFDLAGLDYGGYQVDPVARRRGQRLEEALGQRSHPIEILVKPYARGALALIGESGDKVETILVEKLRRTSEERPLSPGESLADLSEKLGALQISVPVRAHSSGPAVVGLALWDKDRNQPLGFATSEVTVSAYPGQGRPPSIQGSEGLRAVAGAKGMPKADASISIEESNGGNTVAFRLLGGRSLEWSPRRLIREYVSLDGQFGMVRQLELARCQRDYVQVGKFFFDVLFTAQDNVENQIARQAREKLESFIWSWKAKPGNPRPVISVSLNDSSKSEIPFPLGMLALRKGCLLGEAATVTQALTKSNSVPPGTCIGDITTAIPRSLGLGDGCECRKLDKMLVPFREPSAQYLAEFGQVERYLAPQATLGSPQGLLLLAHHADGFLDFHSSFKDALPAERIEREFFPGSAAILISCTVGSVTPLNRSLPVINKLNEKGVGSMIFSPFTINAILGSRLALHFSAEIEENRPVEGPSKEISLRELYDKVLKRVRKDPIAHPYLGDLSLLMLAGNGEVPLCLSPGTKSEPKQFRSECRCNPLVYLKEMLQKGGSWFLGGPSDPDAPTLPKSGVGPGDRAAVRRCMEAAEEEPPPCYDPGQS